MSRYVAVLVVPLIVGLLIAVTVLLINELRERREHRDTALREARRLDGLNDATFSARPTPDDKYIDVSRPSPRTFSRRG